MRILSIVHGDEARTELFRPAVEAQGHALDEWSLAWPTPPPAPIDAYDAFLVFGGAMHADQDDRHPWLRDENLLLQELLDRRVPVLGVCLGAQLLAKAAHAAVMPARRPEIGWHEVELTPEGEADPVLGELPERFLAFQWHYYTHSLPAGAVELARSAVCTQAFRLGDVVWGVQFHPEVTEQQVAGWLASDGRAEGVAVDAVAAETAERIGRWNELGAALCTAWLAAAERAAATVGERHGV
jgi:GMP synthase-like glutamine amidotransferase